MLVGDTLRLNRLSERHAAVARDGGAACPARAAAEVVDFGELRGHTPHLRRALFTSYGADYRYLFDELLQGASCLEKRAENEGRVIVVDNQNEHHLEKAGFDKDAHWPAVVVMPPFHRADATPAERMRNHHGTMHPKLWILQHEGPRASDCYVRVVVSSANLGMYDRLINNQFWCHDFPRLAPPEGCVWRVQGLEKKPQYNGRRVELLSYHADKERYEARSLTEEGTALLTDEGKVLFSLSADKLIAERVVQGEAGEAGEAGAAAVVPADAAAEGAAAPPHHAALVPADAEEDGEWDGEEGMEEADCETRRLRVDARRGARFTEDLLRFLRHLLSPTIEHEPALFASWVHVLGLHDMTPPRGTRLIMSVPGRWRAASRHGYGHLALRRALNELLPASTRGQVSDVEYAVSSMGALKQAEFVRGFSVSLKQGARGDAPVKVVWPSMATAVSTVVRSREAAAHARDGEGAEDSGQRHSLTIDGSTNIMSGPNDAVVREIWHQLVDHIPVLPERRHLLHHMKVAAGFVDEQQRGEYRSCAWLLQGSHNLSGAAWGKMEEDVVEAGGEEEEVFVIMSCGAAGAFRRGGRTGSARWTHNGGRSSQCEPLEDDFLWLHLSRLQSMAVVELFWRGVVGEALSRRLQSHRPQAQPPEASGPAICSRAQLVVAVRTARTWQSACTHPRRQAHV
jgi:hypothetical protein